jgi:PPOX class probable F420-dependent enzyme
VTAEQARDRFGSARVARLATAAADGRPHVVPIVFALALAQAQARDQDQDQDRIYSAVDQKRKRTTELRRLANIAENPQVSVLVDHYEDEWDKLWWARADGRGRILDPVDDIEAQHAIELLRRRYPQQRATGAVLAIDVDRWSGWSAA